MHSLGRAALFCACLIAPASDAQQNESGRLEFGALRFGMSVDEARVASPETQWTVVDRHAETGRAYVIRGVRAVTLAGMPFDLELGSRRRGALTWTLESEATVQDASACEGRALALIAELERHVGEFHPPDRQSDGETRVGVGKSSHAVVSAADGSLRSLTREQALRKDPASFWVRSRHVPAGPEDVEVTVGANYERDKRRTCSTEVRILGAAPTLEHKDIAGRAKLLAQPTISYRNRSLRKVGVPSEPVQFAIPCFVHAGTGTISSCRSDRDADPHRALAAEWALKFQFSLENAQIDDERLLAVEVPVKMGPADVRTVNIGSQRRLDLTQVKVKKQRGPSSLSKLDLAAPVEVSVICEVMEDGSLVCAVKPGTVVPGPIAAASIEVAEGMEIEITLRDGTSAVGGLIERRLTFNPR